MTTLSHSDSRRLYSWWWDSHNSPKNSKWLQENLTDMDSKVKSMIKLIEEDADSFARRAEMYYKKRPELMKLVEEFYRAYRALAERYNHATGELKHAHRTIAKAFPDQLPYELIDDSPSKPRDPHTPETKLPVRKLFDQVDFLDNENDHDDRKAECEVEGLKKALADVAAEKEDVLLKYQQCLEKLSNVERELDSAQRESTMLDEKVNRAEMDVETLKEALNQLEAEKNGGFVKQNEYLEKISNLEAIISRVEEDTKGISTRAIDMKEEISKLELEKEMVVNQHKQCLEKISDLENVISVKEDEVKLLKEKAKRAENEVLELKKSVADLKREKDASALQYKCCLETISKLEREISKLNKDVLIGSIKLKTAEEKSSILEMTNSSLRDEAENLAKKIVEKDLELSGKQDELENLQTCLQDERLSHAKVESALQTLQNLHSKSQDDQMALKSELKNAFHMLKDLEVSKNGLEEEISSLREIKERLEKEVPQHIERSNSLQNEISCLKEEIKELTMSYSKLRQIYEHDTNEKEMLTKKLEDMQVLLNKKLAEETSISDMNCQLADSLEKVKALQESCEFLNGEKSALFSEKVSLLSQLHAITESMHKLLENNAVLENSLSNAKIELEGLREKSKGLEEICEMLKNERSYLLSERGSLVLKLENVEKRLENLEEKCTSLDKENLAVNFRVEELKFSLSVEKQESGARLAGLENQIRFLKEENELKFDTSLKAQFEISILQKFIKDMEEKNYSLIIECQKHVEASKLAEKLISELENGSLEQHVESELLLDEIERLRLSLYQVFRALDNDNCCHEEEKIENEETFVHRILENIEDMKTSISMHEDNKQQLVVENSVLLTLLEQLETKGLQMELQKVNLEEEFKAMAEKLALAKDEKDKLIELNGKLKSDGVVLKAELESLCVKQVDLHEAYNALEKSYSKVDKDNKILLQKFLDLKEEKNEVDKLNDAALLENLESSNQLEILRGFVEEKITEVKSLLDDLNRQHSINSNLEKQMRVLSEKLELQEAENLLLKDAVFKSEKEKQGMREYNVQMKRNILQTEGKLEEAETLNSKLKTDFQELLQKNENLEKNIVQLSENNFARKEEIKGVRVINGNLETELSLLQEKSNEFEGFYFDLQISSSIKEVLFENKVCELTEVCSSLENENASKTSEIEKMKRKICSMESEINGLKSRLSAYAPVVDALRDDITFLEHNALLQTKLKATLNQESEFADDRSRSSSDKPLEDQSLVSLQDFQTRIKAVGKSIEETNKPLLRRKSNSKSKQESTRCLGRKKVHGNELTTVAETPKLQKIKTKASEIRNTMLMKDIPLDQVSNRSLRKRGVNNNNNNSGADDQMLELWEKTAEDGLTIGESLRLSCKMTEKDIVYDPPLTDSDVEKELGVDKLEVSRRISSDQNREVSARRIFERLTSDAQKLENLHITVENLRSKLEESNNKKSKKSKNSVDFETVEEQVLEAEETVEQLVELNRQLVKAMEECPSPEIKASPPLKQAAKTRRRRIMEQARKGSERIGRLQLEVQKIQYMMLKMDEEKKNKVRGKFFRSKTIVLRDFIYNNSNGKKQSGRRKKGPLCGCFRPSASRNGSSSFSSSS